jgi:hypothetical protein
MIYIRMEKKIAYLIAKKQNKGIELKRMMVMWGDR